MKIVIEKQTDKLGDEYLQQEEVLADIWKSGDNLVIEVDEKLYIIPFKLVTCLEK